MNSQNKIKGTGVALVTPFNNNEIDFEALERIIEYVIAGDVDYVVSLGTTGEAVTLTMEECMEVKEFTVKIVKERVPVIYGLFGGSFTARITERLKQYNLDGITALLSSSPNYIKPTQEGIYQHYRTISQASPLPMILYNVPSRTASNISADTVARISHDCPNIIGIKEASGDMYQGSCIKAGSRSDFVLLSGDDLTTLPLIACGGEGVISVISNAFPRTFSRMVSSARQNNFEEAIKLHQKLLKMYQWIFVEGNPAGIKYVLSKIGLCTPEVRIPLMALTTKTAEAMEQDLSAAIKFEQELIFD
jgi:4-hydroxy-tetrahydrodipicolinate synthase